MDTKSDIYYNEEISKTESESNAIDIHIPYNTHMLTLHSVTTARTNLINVEIDPNVINLLNSSLTSCVIII